LSSTEKRRVNRVKQKLADNGVAVGAIMQLASPELIGIAGHAGCDFVLIDCEHGSFQLERAVDLFRAADAIGITPIARVPSNEPSFIMRVLDAGAMGVVIPNVCSKEDIEVAVSAARYKEAQNNGTRGACPGTRATWHQTTDWKGFVRWSNENVMVWALIENSEAVKNIDEILSVAGLNAIMIGPFDLAHDMGYPGESLHPKVTEALERVVKRTQDRGIGVVATFFSTTPEAMAEERDRWVAKGVRVLSIGSDRRLIYTAMARAFDAVRGTCNHSSAKAARTHLHGGRSSSARFHYLNASKRMRPKRWRPRYGNVLQTRARRIERKPRTPRPSAPSWSPPALPAESQKISD
jgi:4-hydroxy-2-oxoheptanedioate aldolase